MHAKSHHERSSSSAAEAGSGQERKVKKQRRYETKVHTIRVGVDGAHEIRGVKTEKGVTTFSTGAASGSRSIDPATTATEGGAGSGGSGGDIGSADAVVSAEGDGASPPVEVVADERAQLWAAHSHNLKAQAFRHPKGHMFRIEIVEVVGSQLTLHWIFPESSPGDASAWIGMWDASTCDWASGRPRGRYTRYKSLTSTRQEGTAKISPKELQGLADGEYFFSIDTGSVSCGAADSSSYCVSQRVKVVNEEVLRLVGGRGAPLPPTSFGSRPRRRSSAATASGGERVQWEEGGDEAEPEEEEEQDFMFEVPLLEYEAGADGSADVKRLRWSTGPIWTGGCGRRTASSGSARLASRRTRVRSGRGASCTMAPCGARRRTARVTPGRRRRARPRATARRRVRPWRSSCGSSHG